MLPLKIFESRTKFEAHTAYLRHCTSRVTQLFSTQISMCHSRQCPGVFIAPLEHTPLHFALIMKPLFIASSITVIINKSSKP